MGRTSLSVGAWTLVSRVTGLGRIATIAAVLGPTYFGNLFQTVNQLPNLAFELVAGQLIATLVVPAIVGHLDRDDTEAASRIVGGFLGVVLAVFSAVALLLTLASPIIAHTLGLGIADATVRSELLHLGWPMVVAVMAQLPLYGFIGVANAAQNARGRFGLAAAAPAVENLAVIATLVAFKLTRPELAPLGGITVRDALFLGAGSTLGVALHALLQGWGARRAGLTVRPRAGWRDPQVRALTRMAGPSLGVAMLTVGQTFALLVVAGSVAGGVVALQLGLAFVATAVSLGARPVAVAVLPVLARLRARGLVLEFRQTYGRAIIVVVFVTAPVAAAMIGLSPALARAVAHGAMGGGGATTLVAAAIAGLGLAVVAEGATQLITQAAFTQSRPGIALEAALIRAGAAAAGFGLARHVTDPAGLIGAAGVAYSVAALGAAAYLHQAITTRMPFSNDGIAQQSRTILGATLLALVPAAAMTWAAGDPDGVVGRLAPAALGTGVLAAGYLAVTAWAGVGGVDVLAPARLLVRGTRRVRYALERCTLTVDDRAAATTVGPDRAATADSNGRPALPARRPGLTGWLGAWAAAIAAAPLALAVGSLGWAWSVGFVGLGAALLAGFLAPGRAAATVVLWGPLVAGVFGHRNGGDARVAWLLVSPVVAVSAGLLAREALAHVAIREGAGRLETAVGPGRSPARRDRGWTLIAAVALAASGAATLTASGAATLTASGAGQTSGLGFLAGAGVAASAVALRLSARSGRTMTALGARGAVLALPLVGAVTLASGPTPTLAWAACGAAVAATAVAGAVVRRRPPASMAPIEVVVLLAAATTPAPPVTRLAVLACGLVAAAVRAHQRRLSAGSTTHAAPASAP